MEPTTELTAVKLSPESIDIVKKATQRARTLAEDARREGEAILKFATTYIAGLEGLDGPWDLDIESGVATKRVDK